MTDLTSHNMLRVYVLVAFHILLSALASFGFTIIGDPADGEIHFNTTSVSTGGNELQFGHRGVGGADLVTAIYLFELPDLNSTAVHNTALQFSFLNRTGDFTINPANVDVWGLGYITGTTIDPDWHLLGDVDTRTGNDLGTGIGTTPVIRIADDFLTDDSNDPGSLESYRLALSNPALTDYIRLLYDQGAVAGDFAIIRVNIDAATSSGERGIDIASANATNVADRPVLSINENTTLLFDPFTDGDRTNGDDLLDTDWYSVSSSLTLSVTNDPGGIGDGNGLRAVMGLPGRRFMCGFPGITLADPGDFIQVRCTFLPTLQNGADESFRAGLMTANGTPVVADTVLGGGQSTYTGYLVRMSTAGFIGSFGDLSSVGVTNGSFLGGSQDLLSRHSDALPVAQGDVHTLFYTITRASSTQMTTRVELSSPTTTVLLNGMDPGTDTDMPDWYFEDTFDAFGIGCGNNNEQVNFFLDNVIVETSVPLFQTVPHTEVLVDVLELEVDTQLHIKYGLQETSDLIDPDWMDSGYILTGDGSSLKVYDPAIVETSKFYRMENQP